MNEEIDLKYLCWIMHRIHMTPLDEYVSLAYIWARDALERYRARDRTTAFSTFLFHFIRCKWSGYRARKDFQNGGAFIPQSASSNDDLEAIEILADLARTTTKNFYEAAVLISMGYTCKEAAEALAIKPSTLYLWIRRFRKSKGENI